MIIEISVAIIALSFAVLVVYLILTLNSVRKTLKNTDRTLLEFHHEFKGLSQSTQKVAENVLSKAKSLDPIFHSLYEIGSVAEKRAENYRLSALKEKSESIEQIAQLAVIGLNLWNAYKKGRK
ncbi:MAG: DUF948 domain-containing protein [Parachlamydiaceae bacterium]